MSVLADSKMVANEKIQIDSWGKIRIAKLLNLKLLKAKFYILQKNLGQIYKNKNAKLHTKGQFCIYVLIN
ncbi:hypothetical protein R7U62_03485 [Mesomycoplasma ovipneumoniae]|uniref:hypothetical protein n=1 Tax=Mesomycoplasma ovipneumoniae TaxID=29562 RepID=UPI0029653EC9|nr:hypothetical protein [Mesomycoplasma ovipneumoniae]MDW2913147.1 hypothetical protein [Mesomycoplasma ovipneumoniae]MDW2918320.1 hypothetical protein [Mesomycoplasma ovipneumoniae]MDW2920410.1 hypothetical protein [Mesomycoplasma ovipneumoniae]MDW2922823.1 hypothetical protein [Mesomycoplasma ovipneumoniae]